MKQPDSIDIDTRMDIAKKELTMQTIAAMDEFQSIIGENPGWDSEEDMIKDMARSIYYDMDSYFG